MNNNQEFNFNDENDRLFIGRPSIQFGYPGYSYGYPYGYPYNYPGYGYGYPAYYGYPYIGIGFGHGGFRPGYDGFRWRL